MPRPFDGIRVLDFTRVVAGPFATQLLALLGADVIKFERPDGRGDEARFFCSNHDLLAKGMGSVFLSLNGGKRSVAIDLKDPAKKSLVLRMARSSDVVVENFRPGVMERLGLGYEDLKAVKPDIVYCSMSGFGQTGPEGGRAGYDGAMQAMSGLMSITGHPESGPTRVGFPVIDFFSGYAAALAVASALFRRAGEGRGQYIDVSMLDVSLSTMRSVIAWWSAGGDLILRGNQAWTRLPTSDCFHGSDGPFMLVVNNYDQLRVLLGEIGLLQVLEDPRFGDWLSVVENGPAFRVILEARFAIDTAADWERRLTKAGLAVATIRTIPEALKDPQLAHRDLLLSLDGAKGIDGPITFLNAPFMFAEDGPGVDRPPPALGEHTDEVLREFGAADGGAGAKAPAFERETKSVGAR